MPLLLRLDVKAPPVPVGRCTVVVDFGGYFVGRPVCSPVRNRCGGFLRGSATTDLLPPLGHVDITSLSSGVSEYAFTGGTSVSNNLQGKYGINTHEGDAREGGPEIDSDDQLRLGGGRGSHDFNICIVTVFGGGGGGD